MSPSHTMVTQRRHRPSLLIYMLMTNVCMLSALPMHGELERAALALATIFPSSEFGKRLQIGRMAQLGPDMIYRPGAIGCDVDTGLTYGEFALDHFACLVERALDGSSAEGLTFVDIGSGCGRLVFAAKLLWPELACTAGIEIVPELHALALAAAARTDIPAAPRCQFICGDAAHALAPTGALADADILFAYSSAFPSEGDLLSDLSAVCGTCLKVGARVITTDKRLCSVDGLWAFEELDTITGVNHETGGTSVGYVYRVTCSQRREQK